MCVCVCRSSLSLHALPCPPCSSGFSHSLSLSPSLLLLLFDGQGLRMLLSPLRPTRLLLASSQVLGAAVPSFARFPYKYRDTLYLYKEFLKLIHHHYPPEERRDLLFRLRNEFQSKRHLSGRKLIAAAVRRGEGVLLLQKQMLDRRYSQQLLPQESGEAAGTRSLGVVSGGGADNVDAVWAQLQHVSHHMVPGLSSSRSVNLTGDGSPYLKQALTKSVHRRRG